LRVKIALLKRALAGSGLSLCEREKGGDYPIQIRGPKGGGEKEKKKKKKKKKARKTFVEGSAFSVCAEGRGEKEKKVGDLRVSGQSARGKEE